MIKLNAIDTLSRIFAVPTATPGLVGNVSEYDPRPWAQDPTGEHAAAFEKLVGTRVALRLGTDEEAGWLKV